MVTGYGGTITIGGTKLAIRSWAFSPEPAAELGQPIGPPAEGGVPAIVSAKVTYRVSFEPGAWLDLVRLSALCATLDAAVASLECRRWHSRGGPLSGWYRGRPGWRLADLCLHGRT